MREKLLPVAVRAAKSAGKLLRAHYGKLSQSQIATKSKNDFVTVLDKRSEKIVISTVKKSFPSHGFYAEESGREAGSEYVWVIDPLDGTSNYIHHFPMFAVSIGVAKGDTIVAAVVYDPIHDELFTAEKGRGAFLNGKRIRVSGTRRLADAFMATGIPFRARERFDQYVTSFKTISMASAGMRRGGSAALDLAYVACGRFDGFWELDLSPWDIAAGALLIEEAGGKIADMWGKNRYLATGDIMGSNPHIYKELRQITGRLFTPGDVPPKWIYA